MRGLPGMCLSAQRAWGLQVKKTQPRVLLHARQTFRHVLARAGFASRSLPLCVLLTVLASCANFDVEHAPEAAVVPAEAPRVTGVETPASSEQKRLVAQFGGEYRAPAAQAYLNEILVKLAAASDTPAEPYRVTILNSPVVNAFALPPANLFVTRGLLSLANDTAEVAAVMAHEIAHVTARHASQRAEMERRSEVISQAASVIQSREKGQEVQASSRLSIAGFSRQQELDADQIGVRVIARAGYDPFAASRFLAALGRSTALRASLIGASAGAGKPDILSTHPSTPDRVAQAINAARQIAAPGVGEDARARYLAAIDGIAYGDDPQDGYIRGRRFVHPRLGFAFVAPEGFVLTNSAQAVLGVAAGGAEALRLDSVKVAATTALETYLGSGWIDGLQTNTVQTQTINGLPAATATARAGEWSFRLAAIRLNESVYRLIFATRTFDAPSDVRYRQSIDSFRATSAEETAKVRSLRIQIVTAQEGDTAEAFAARIIAPDRPLEHFMLLNGLEKAGPLKAGEKYKLVVE